MLDLDPATVVRKGRLQPGRMFLVDTDARPDRRGRRDQGRARRRAPVRRVAARRPDPPRRPARARARRAHARVGAPAPADVRLHRGGAARSSSRRWRATAPSRSARWAPTRPIAVLSEPAAAAVRLLHPAVRAGHQPAAGRDPRGARHLAGDRIGPEQQPARPRRRRLPPGRAAVPGHRQRRAGEDRPRQPRRRPARLRVRTRRAVSTTSPAAARRCARARRDLRRGVARRSRTARASSCCPTATRTTTWRRSRRCC